MYPNLQWFMHLSSRKDGPVIVRNKANVLQYAILSSETTRPSIYFILTDCKVPAENILGKKCICNFSESAKRFK